VHGITADHVREAAEFPGMPAEFHAELDGVLVLAHRAGFDAGVMQGSALAYRVKPPKLRYLCTFDIARRM
jgi:DNA polymerase-3 subunit epsilon